jgi:hypothetical protein
MNLRGGVYTLADVVEAALLHGGKTPVAITCSKCPRAGQLPLRKLVQEHGRHIAIPDLLRQLSADCPKRASINATDVCGARLPEVPWLMGFKNAAKDAPWMGPDDDTG